MKNMILAFAAGLLTTFLVASSPADTYFETNDAGNTIPTAIMLGDNITQVEASLNSDHDLWGFNIYTSQEVQIVSGFSSFDDNLILFDEMGRGLAGNDDIGRGSASPGINLPQGIGGLDSEIFVFLDPGVYYFGVGNNNSGGYTTNDVLFIDNDSGLLTSPTTETLGYVGGSQGTGSYTIFLNRTIPEPGATLLLTLAAMGVAAVRRRKTTG